MSDDTPGPDTPGATPETPVLVRAGSALFRALSSFALAIVVLFFLLLLTFLGTLEQAETSLFEVQRTYFESLLVWHPVFGVPVPLPGVYLLLVLLAVNLVCGGLVRIRKGKATIGVLVTHVGVLMLLAGGLVEFHYSTKGHLTLVEGDRAAEYESYYEWEITVAEADGPREWVVPGELWLHLRRGATATFTHPDLPFRMAVGSPLPHCEPRPASQRREGDFAAVNGWYLASLPRSKEAERDIAGVYVRVEEPDGGAEDGILWGAQEFPLSVRAGGKDWFVDLHKRRWSVPYAIRLDEFRAEFHPRSGGMAKAFESDVTRFDGSSEQRIRISMNRPLRESGYTFFQSSYNRARDGRWISTFSVVRNPADQVPLYACIVMALGLVIHFLRKLLLHIRGTRRSVPA